MRLSLAALAVSIAMTGGFGPGPASAAPARLTPEQASMVAIPRTSVPPKIDGAIEVKEWREACAISGLVDQGTDILLPRPTTYYLAWDPGHLYFACRTYIRPNYKPGIRDGRSPGMAYCYDDGLELLFKPLGANVSAMNHQTAFRLFLNCLGYVGDLTRLAVGQQLKNWAPEFQTAARLTAPGTAPDGGRWLELEVSTSTRDFELTGNHQAGDKWFIMLGFNHIPGWMQARIPCVGSYFTPEGKTEFLLVENTPAVQFTMDSLQNLASDGTAALMVRAFNPAQAEAQVTVNVDVAGKIATTDTLTLAAGGESLFALAEKLPADVKAGEFSVSVKQDERVLLKYHALFQVGQYNWMLAPVKPADPAKFAFEARWNPLHQVALVKADSYYLPDPKAAKALKYRVTAETGGAPVAEGAITNVAEWYFQDLIALPALKEGKYRIEGSLELADGRTLGPLSATIEKKDESKAFPEWWGRKFGNVERVLPPFEAMKRVQVAGFRVQEKGGSGPDTRNLTPDTFSGFSCWGREYALNALGLPTVVKSQGEAVLASGARVVATVGGKEVTIPLGRPKITEQKEWRVRFTGQAGAAGLKLAATGWLEQDGLVYVELTYGPDKKPIRLEALRIEFPLADADADCLVCIGPGANFSSKTTMLLPKDKLGQLWSTLVTGITGCQMKVGSFYPTVWIGSERRGFLWWADNDKGWVQDNAVPAHEVVRVKGQGSRVEGEEPDTRHSILDTSCVVLRNNIVAHPIELTDARTVAFSYMATPVKPFPQGWRMIAATDDGTFFEPFRGVRTNPKTGTKYHNSAAGNINWIHPESADPAEWSTLWAEQKKSADALVALRRPFDLYAARTGVSFQHMSFQLMGYGVKSMQQELYDYFGDEWFPGGEDTWNESYTDYAMYLFDRVFREGGVVSTYWDLTFPINFSGLLTGLAYRLPDGRIQPGYNGWNVRRFFMRLWALQQDAGLNPGCTGTHSTNAYIPIAMPWIDAILDGERDWNLDVSDMDWIDYYPIERMRSMSSPHNWGIGLCWMSNYTSRDPAKVIRAKEAQAEYLWMQDSWLNPYINPAAHMIEMPAAVLDWGLNGAEVTYYAYWRNSQVACQDKDVLVSLWQIGKGRALIGVFNYSKTDTKNVRLDLDLAKLGFSPDATTVRDLYMRKNNNLPAGGLDAKAGTLTLNELPPHMGRFIGVRTVQPQAVAKFQEQMTVAAAGATAPAAADLAVWAQDYGLLGPGTEFQAAGGVSTVIAANAALKISLWRTTDRVLLAIANTGKQLQDATLKLDLDKLGLTPALVWQQFIRVRDLNKGEKEGAAVLDYYGRTLTIKGIQPQALRLIAIRRY